MMRLEEAIRQRLKDELGEKERDWPLGQTYKDGFVDALRWVLTDNGHRDRHLASEKNYHGDWPEDH